MPPRYRGSDLHEHVVAVMVETGEDDPFDAVRKKAREVVATFHTFFGDAPPFNVTGIASMRGLHWSDDDPRFSLDSEIAPEADGRVVLRVNRDRPATRQRFSICHEVGHTLFPEYELAVRCRKGSERTFADPDDLLETLCDVAASELMFPLPWFEASINSIKLSAQNISDLASKYIGSPEATVRRLVELHADPLAAVFFSWKLKPTELRAVRLNRNVRPLFSDVPLGQPSPMLRVDYAIINDGFASRFSDHIPKDKSVPCDGPIYSASVSRSPQDGEMELDLGTLHRRFSVHVLPIFKAAPLDASAAGSSVVAVLRLPEATRPSRSPRR